MEYLTAILILGLGLLIGRVVCILKAEDEDWMPDINDIYRG